MGIMKWELFKKVVDEANEIGVELLHWLAEVNH